MILAGQSASLGATCDGDGVNFALYAGSAEAVELCLFDAQRNPVAHHYLPEQSDGVWNGYLPGCRAGQRYGYRVHGPWAPEEGLRHNPAKLLMDPWARRVEGSCRWAPEVFDYQPGAPRNWRRDERDSAAFVPLCVVEAPPEQRTLRRPAIAWTDRVIYETNVRGFTMRHPALSEAERGRLGGLRNGEILAYLKSLGITSVELMPVFTMIDEAFLADRGRRNLWGYNSLQFFTPDARFCGEDGVAEFRGMVDAIHDAGLEVLLDVAYNHTGEGGALGPSFSLRGIDNLAYYRTEPQDPGVYINDTGCGNTLNADNPWAQRLVLDSLRYWHREMGVDGFRFDLATVLGRTATGYMKRHGLLNRIGSDPALEGALLIAEPWDPGPGGYQLGRFPAVWCEWNDRYRDAVRRFWRGDSHQSAELARRIHGSSDLFQPSGRNPTASINFVTSHDGFTLSDLVSYSQRHNEANGENNHDGHPHNFSDNHGVEGGTDDPAINALRRRQRLNLLGTLLFSHGTPMLLAGDEFGNSQAGNNNAYAQDNETGWLDWAGLEADPEFTGQVRELLRIRREQPMLRQARYVHGRMPTDQGWSDIRWLRPDGRKMADPDWNGDGRLVLLYSTHVQQKESSPATDAVALLFNSAEAEAEFTLPDGLPPNWSLRFSSSPETAPAGPGRWRVPGRTLALLTGSIEDS